MASHADKSDKWKLFLPRSFWNVPAPLCVMVDDSRKLDDLTGFLLKTQDWFWALDVLCSEVKWKFLLRGCDCTGRHHLTTFMFSSMQNNIFAGTEVASHHRKTPGRVPAYEIKRGVMVYHYLHIKLWHIFLSTHVYAFWVIAFDHRTLEQ